MAIFPLVLKKFPAFCEQNSLRTCAPSWSVRKSLRSLTNSLSVHADKLKQVKQGIPNPWKKMLLVFSQIKKTQPTKKIQNRMSFLFFLSFFLNHCHIYANILIAKMSPAALQKQCFTSQWKPITPLWRNKQKKSSSAHYEMQCSIN